MGACLDTKYFRLFLFAILSLSMASCAGALVDQKLYWKSTSDPKDFDIGSLSKHKFKIAPFQDERKMTPKNKIAENTEGEKIRVVTADTDDLSEYVTQNVTQVLDRSGLELATSGDAFVITGVIKDLFVSEASLYKGSATIKYVVKKGDQVVWSGVETGGSKRFGRSYKMENYMEAMSDALVDSLLKFLRDPDFRRALK